MRRSFALVLIPLVVVAWAATASAGTPPNSAGCAFGEPLTIDQAVNTARPFLLGDPAAFRDLAISADNNHDGLVCLRVGEHVNPHFNARRVHVFDNTVGPKDRFAS